MKKTEEAGLLNLIKSQQRNMPVTYKYIKEVNIMKVELIQAKGQHIEIFLAISKFRLEAAFLISAAKAWSSFKWE